MHRDVEFTDHVGINDSGRTAWWWIRLSRNRWGTFVGVVIAVVSSVVSAGVGGRGGTLMGIVVGAVISIAGVLWAPAPRTEVPRRTDEDLRP